LQHPVGAVDKTLENLMGVSPLVPGPPLVEQRLGAGGFLGGRQEQEGQVIGALEMQERVTKPSLCDAVYPSLPGWQTEQSAAVAGNFM
jgi:hypothetical protein